MDQDGESNEVSEEVDVGEQKEDGAQKMKGKNSGRDGG